MSSRNRAAVKRRVRDIAAHVLPGVKVAYTWPGDNPTDATLFLGLTEGTEVPESIGWGATLSKDEFTIEGTIVLFGFRDPEVAEETVEAKLRLFDDALRSSQELARVPGLDDGDTASYSSRCRIGAVSGPKHGMPTDDNTVEGWAEFTIDCVTDLT